MNDPKQKIISEALSLIDPVSSNLDEETTAQTKENNFNLALNTMLGRWSWSAFFRRSLIQNSTSAQGEHYKFNKKFPLPFNMARFFGLATDINEIDFVTIAKIWSSNEEAYTDVFSFRDYEKMGNFIYSNANQIYVAYMHNVFEEAGVLDPSFISALTQVLAGYFAYSIRSNLILSKYWGDKAEVEIKYAINADELAYRNEESNPNNVGAF